MSFCLGVATGVIITTQFVSFEEPLNIQNIIKGPDGRPLCGFKVCPSPTPNILPPPESAPTPAPIRRSLRTFTETLCGSAKGRYEREEFTYNEKATLESENSYEYRFYIQDAELKFTDSNDGHDDKNALKVTGVSFDCDLNYVKVSTTGWESSVEKWIDLLNGKELGANMNGAMWLADKSFFITNGSDPLYEDCCSANQIFRCDQRDEKTGCTEFLGMDEMKVKGELSSFVREGDSLKISFSRAEEVDSSQEELSPMEIRCEITAKKCRNITKAPSKK